MEPTTPTITREFAPLPGPGDVPAPTFSADPDTYIATPTPREAIDVNITIRQEPAHTSAYVAQPEPIPDHNPTAGGSHTVWIPVGLIAVVGWRVLRALWKRAS